MPKEGAGSHKHREELCTGDFQGSLRAMDEALTESILQGTGKFELRDQSRGVLVLSPVKSEL